MRIGIYADTAKEAEPRGVGFYVVNLINALARLGTNDQFYLYYQRDLTSDPGLYDFRLAALDSSASTRGMSNGLYRP